ncbi:MAG: response regulator, partial [Lysobacterales bacterium]
MAQTILLIQEDPAGAKAVRDALIQSSDGPFQVEWTKSCSDALQRLSGQGQHGADAIAAVLLDLFLPDSCGIGTCERLFHAAPQIPMLVLSAPQHEDLARLAVQRGAQD